MDEGELFHSRKETHAVGYLEVGDAIWRVVTQRTRDAGSKTYLQTLHKVHPRQLDADRRRLKRSDR